MVKAMDGGLARFALHRHIGTYAVSVSSSYRSSGWPSGSLPPFTPVGAVGTLGAYCLASPARPVTTASSAVVLALHILERRPRGAARGSHRAFPRALGHPPVRIWRHLQR